MEDRARAQGEANGDDLSIIRLASEEAYSTREGVHRMSERASEMIATQLRRKVITGELDPGSVVSEAQLANVLDCGRTPLREALQQLTHEYLVLTPPRRGILIPQLGIVDYRQLSEAQMLMGSVFAELAAERISEGQLKDLKDIIARQQRCNEHADFYNLAELDGHFHTLIAKATGNRFFADFTSRLHGALAPFVFRAYEAVGNADLSIAEHRDIVESLETGDGTLAKLATRDHVAKATQRVLNILGLGEQSAGA
jgi:DNA-binding GntR family transcriptional regulator